MLTDTLTAALVPGLPSMGSSLTLLVHVVTQRDQDSAQSGLTTSCEVAVHVC